jgi:hypothetical protein
MDFCCRRIEVFPEISGGVSQLRYWESSPFTISFDWSIDSIPKPCVIQAYPRLNKQTRILGLSSERWWTYSRSSHFVVGFNDPWSALKSCLILRAPLSLAAERNSYVLAWNRTQTIHPMFRCQECEDVYTPRPVCIFVQYYRIQG